MPQQEAPSADFTRSFCDWCDAANSRYEYIARILRNHFSNQREEDRTFKWETGGNDQEPAQKPPNAPVETTSTLV